MLLDSVVVRTCPLAIPLAMITITKILHGFPFLSMMTMGLRLAAQIVAFKVIPLKLFYYQTFFETWPD